MNEILESLNINFTIIVQFGIACAFFFIAQPLFFNRLRDVLLLREENTTALEAKAEDDFEKVNELIQKHEQQMEEAYQQAQRLLAEKRAEVKGKIKVKVDQAQSEADTYLKKKQAELAQEVEQNRSLVLAQSGPLSDQLVSKLVQ